MRTDTLQPPSKTPRHARLLVIDDHEDLALALSATLSAARFAGITLTVERHNRAASALEHAEAHPIDVAVVDIQLPDMSGVQLLRSLKMARPHCEIIIMTGFATMGVAIDALHAGAFAFVEKSFRPEELIATVEQALRKAQLQRDRDELEQRYLALVELTDVLVMGLDEHDRVVFFNRKALSVAGCTQDDAAGRPFVETWVAESEHLYIRETMRLIRSDGLPREVEAWFVDFSGAPRTVVAGKTRRRRIRWHLSRSSPHTYGMVYGIGTDVTVRRELEKRAADAEAMSVMGRLALSLAHEIRNPLNAAVLQLHLLGRYIQKLPVDAETIEAMQQKAHIVGDEIGRLNRLLTEFLELSNVRQLGSDVVDLREIVSSVLALEADAVRAKGIELAAKLARQPCLVLGDGEKLKQVFINVLVNAIEAMPEGGTLQVQVDVDKGHVRMTVIDTGPGIDVEILDQVFDPFFTTKEAGTGLGLSIVRKIVEHHGGTVSVSSERGKGTEVTMVIPIAKSLSPPALAGEAPSSLSRREKGGLPGKPIA